MKNIKLIKLFIAVVIGTNSHSQVTFESNAYSGGRFLGFNNTNGTNPLFLRTNNITRMSINGATGVTEGFVGINTINPLFRLHVVGSGAANSQGWSRGLLLSNSAALMWEGAPNTGRHYFMAHSSSAPLGDFYQGYSEGMGAGAPVNYASKVYVTSGAPIPLATTHIFKWLLVQETGFERKFGVNVTNPFRVAEIKSNMTPAPQLRLTTTNNAWADFQTLNTGNLVLLPQSGRVGINLTTNPTANLDVNGDARIRNVATATPNSILIGVNANGPSDVNVRRLDFTGNAGQVLLGNGTWGTLSQTPPPAANNGVSRYTLFAIGSPYQLGDQYGAVPPFLNTNTPLTVDRQVRLNNQNFVFSGSGKVGIGLTFPTMPTEVLDVNGNARLRNLPTPAYMADNTVDKIVMVDSNGVLRWGAATGSFGAACSDNVNGKLQFDTKVDLNNYNLYFSKNDQLSKNMIGIGYDCGTVLPAKVGVRQLYNQTVPFGTTAGHFYNSDIANTILLTFTGVQGIADGLQDPSLRPINIGGKFTSRNSGVNHGVNIDISNNLISNSINYGIFSRVEDYNASISYGMRSETRGAAGHAYGLYVIAASNYTTNPVPTQQTTGASIYSFGGSIENIAVRAISGGDDVGIYASGGVNFGVKAYAKYGTSNYAIYGETTPGQANSYAGYFVGQVVQNQPSVPSDQQFKTNIEDIENADSLLAVIRPVTYDYQTSGNSLRMNFPSGIQYGMIAQEVESVMPELVKTVEHPAIIDSAGNEIEPSFDYKVLNYEAFLPILIKGHQQQAADILAKDSIIDSLQTQIADLNSRLSQLENCLSGILPYLCQLSQSAIQANTPEAQEMVRSNLNVTLSSRNTIILDQNVPNPFAEQTVINFSIPETVKKAQIHFYDALGKLIQSVDVVERGLGSLTVFGSDLSSGIYTYTLVADGQAVATKKMMKQ